uniref:Putative cell adhesion protein n=1 Tax=Leptolyngbya boryana TaxID=1184 RepID=Q9AM08_LEPBY|nr:putative cell adhesion protein [Leptolyngbya boryana]
MRGDLGFIPVLVTLALITLYFQLTTCGIFLQARNLTNLTQQIVVISILSTAAVLVLLLGEIDLSLAAVAQACAAIMATLSVYQNWGAIPSILAALVAGAIIGLVNGLFYCNSARPVVYCDPSRIDWICWILAISSRATNHADCS